MTNKRYSYIPQRMKSVNKEDPYVTGSEDIDAGDGKSQQVKNTEVDETLTQLSNEIDAVNKQDIIPVDTLPAVATADPKKIYRVVGEDSYTDYMVNATGDDWKKLTTYSFPGIDDKPTAGSDNLVKSGGIKNELALGAVYDVSAKNPTAGPNNDGKWESLSVLLSDANLNTLIPTAVRKGGMSVKYVQSSDNKYVQYRLTAQSFTTDVTQWEGSIDDAAGIGVFNKTNSADKITNIKQQSAQYGALSGEGYLFIMPEYTLGNLDKDTGEINPNSNRKTTQFIDAASEDVTINVSGGIRICIYDLTNHQFEGYADKNVPSYTLEKGHAYRISLDISSTIYLQYTSNLKKIVSKVNPISEYLDVLSEKSSKGVVSIYPDFVPGNLNKDTGEIVSMGNRKTTKLFYSPYNLSLEFNGTIRICQYDLNGVFISYSDNTYNHDVILQTGYAYRISTDSEYDLLIYFNRNISELVTKNLSPSNKANVIAGGYINASSGNNGNFGSVEANKTYVFSCLANVKSANCSNIQIRLNYSGTYKAIGFINTSTITKNKDVYCFVTIKPDVDGYLTLTGSSFISDVGTVLFDCQVEEGSTPTGYVPYNNQSAIDYISRSQIADWKKGKYLPYASGVKSVAHQGYREFGANANTLQAYIDAKKAGFDMVETDVIMTLDRVPVISHDDVRTTVDNVSVTISNTNYSDLAEMQFYSDPSIKIPTLWEAFNTCNIHNIGVMLEFKGANFTQQEINEILNYAKGLGIYVMYVSFISSTLITVRSIDENASVSFTLTQVPTIQELQTDSDYQYLRNAIAQSGKTSICGDFTSEDWILQAKKLGYSIILDYANHIVNKTLIPYAFACLSNEYTVNELT